MSEWHRDNNNGVNIRSCSALQTREELIEKRVSANGVALWSTSRPQKPEAFASADYPDPCRRVATTPTSAGKLRRSSAQRRRRSMGSCCPLSDRGRRFMKRPNCCKGSLYKNVVRFCKAVLPQENTCRSVK